MRTTSPHSSSRRSPSISPERYRRLDLMADRVDDLDARLWAQRFLKRMGRFAQPEARTTRPLDETARMRIGQELEEAPQRSILLDYDGTLREIVGHPDLATPTAEIRELLADLAALPGHRRPRRQRPPARVARAVARRPAGSPLRRARLLRARAGRRRGRRRTTSISRGCPGSRRCSTGSRSTCPGTLVERKAASVAWHYRQAEPDYGAWRARELLVALDHTLLGARGRGAAGPARGRGARARA